MLRVCGREDDGRLVRDAGQHLGSEQPRHLNVEKDEVRLSRVDGIYRIEAMDRLSDDVDPVVDGEHVAQSGARHRLVIRDQCGDSVPGRHVSHDPR